MRRALRRVLVVDDDADTCALIADILTEDGYVVSSSLSGEQALDTLRQERIDLVLADIKMPRMTGIDLLQHIREEGRDTEVILMTAYASLETAIQALRNGAIDYLIKPFALSDLRRRVREALPDEDEPERGLCYRDLCLDVDARRVWVGRREVQLTRQEFDLLACLFNRRGCTVSWEELLRCVWGYDEPQRENIGSLRSCIRRLRLKVGDDARSPRYIINRWGEGYRLGE